MPPNLKCPRLPLRVTPYIKSIVKLVLSSTVETYNSHKLVHENLYLKGKIKGKTTANLCRKKCRFRRERECVCVYKLQKYKPNWYSIGNESNKLDKFGEKNVQTFRNY